MKIIALPDLHQAIDRLKLIAQELQRVDLVLLVGDLTNAGKAEDAIQVLDAIAQFNENILAVPGNWDTVAVEEILTTRSINLHGSHCVIDDIGFLGVGGSLPLNDTPNEIPESMFEAFLNAAIAQMPPVELKILVSHEPPFNGYILNDRPWVRVEMGSKAVRTFIEQYQPMVCFTGHIHEAQGVTTIERTQVVNPGPLWQGKYAFVEIIASTINIELRSIQ